MTAYVVIDDIVVEMNKEQFLSYMRRPLKLQHRQGEQICCLRRILLEIDGYSEEQVELAVN